jgi:hypothetical protein
MQHVASHAAAYLPQVQAQSHYTLNSSVDYDVSATVLTLTRVERCPARSAQRVVRQLARLAICIPYEVEVHVI